MKWVILAMPASADNINSGALRKSLKSRLDTMSRRMKKDDEDAPKGSRILQQALDSLVAAGVLGKSTEKKKGHPVSQVRKRKWAEILSSESAAGLCTQLSVGSNAFPGD